MSGTGNLFDGYLTEQQFCEAIGKTPRTARLWRKRRYGPPYVRIGREIYYPLDDAQKWLRSQMQMSGRPPKKP